MNPSPPYYTPSTSAAFTLIFSMACKARYGCALSQRQAQARPIYYTYEGSEGSDHFFKHWSGNPDFSFIVTRAFPNIPAGWYF